MSTLAIGTITTTLATLTTLVILFFWTTNGIYGSNNNNNNNGDDDDDNNSSGGSQDQWWEFDMKREEQAAFKVLANVAVLSVACATLFVPMVRIWHPSKGLYDRYNLGGLAASTFLVGNMLFVSFWYSAGFLQGEEENGSNDNNNDNDDGNDDDGNNYDDAYEMDEEELLAYHQNIVSTVSLVLACALLTLSACIFAAARQLTEMVHGSNDEVHVRVRSAAHMEIFAAMWKLLSACTLVVLCVLFLVAWVLSLGEEGEGRREEGGASLTVVLLWVIGVTIGMTVLGRKVLSDKALGTLGAGMLLFGTVYYALLLFVVFLFFVSPEFGDPGEEGGPAGTAVAVACFFLSMLHVAFSMGMHKYQKSMILGAQEEMEEVASAGFQRMEDDDESRRMSMEDDESEAGSARGSKLV